MKPDWTIVTAILRKDLRSLYPLVLLAIAVFAGDVLITRLDLMPAWAFYRSVLILLAATVVTLGIFQLDSPTSLVDDWLCRPVARRELLLAKLIVVFGVVYGSRAVATLVADLILGYGLAESLLEALLLQDIWFMFVLPVLLMTAIVTGTLIQGIGVLIAMFVVIFVIPTPLVGPPDPLDPTMGEALSENGMGWMITAAPKLAATAFLALCFHLAYWRRRIDMARIALVVSTAVTLVLVISPMFIVPWSAMFSLQESTLASRRAVSDDAAERITLFNPRNCFPATRAGVVGTDAAFNAALQMAGAPLWNDNVLRAAGPDSLAMLTVMQVQGLPLDWRAHLMHAQVDYRDAAGELLFSLRPARYLTQGSALAHSWLVPDDALARLEATGEPSLDLRYSLALLAPEIHELPVDGVRHVLPGVGYCSASMDGTDDRIEVDCFTASHSVAQLSAELVGVPATRAYGAVDLSPGWTRWMHSKRVELAITSPRLAAHERIRVIAWQQGGYVTRSWTGAGILGEDLAGCPLPTTGGDSFESTRWRDAVPHETYSISMEPGVQVEVLDFGGEGSAMLLVPGLGATAHSFDELAPLLAQEHRVLAMTRRGTGSSSKPDHGYDTATLSRDILRVMDEMALDKVVLVGHSMAGDELTWLGGHHPGRFHALVYLDAAYDRSREPDDRYRELNRLLPPAPPPSPRAMRDFAGMLAYIRELDGVPLPEGELIALHQMNKPFIAGTPSIDERTQQAIAAGVGPPDYAAVKVPALALYAVPAPGESGMRPWHDPNDAVLRATLRELAERTRERQRSDIETFRENVADARVVELVGAAHYIFQSNRDDVLRAIDEFLDGIDLR